MALATILGYPRIGRDREMKRALEGYWAGKVSRDEILATARQLRLANWRTQREAGIDLLPVNDFTLYDQVLDTVCLVGAVPPQYGWSGDRDVDLDTYFAMARGRTGEREVRALDMTKWFDTNYHYIVPELTADQRFGLASEKPFTELAEARAADVYPKVVLVGPATFLLLSKTPEGEPVPFEPLLERLTPVYAEAISRLAAGGAKWIQLDEISLMQDRTPAELAAIESAYAQFAAAKGAAKLLVHTAFGQAGESYPLLARLPVDGIGLDLTGRGRRGNLELLARHGFPAEKALAAGVVDGRNVWTNDLSDSLDVLGQVRRICAVTPDRLMVSASSSLQHVPIDASRETHLDPEILSWLAFAEQKLREVALLTRAVDEGEESIRAELEANRRVIESHATSPRRNNPEVRERLKEFAAKARRPTPFAERSRIQQERLGLPPLPTTTIGSFPQTPGVRAIRRRFEKGEIGVAEYEAFIEGKIREVIRLQEELGLDVLVHGEFERNDMVQYFGEQLEGFAFTRHGWVQSYGSRYVRPPIIYGDVRRPRPMTVRWSTFTQSLTDRPVKGMLTGPVTILNWSFVRDDQPRADTCRQIALAIRDEVQDLEAAGIRVIQIDEPALREGLPLRRAEWEEYLRWAVDAFRLTSSGVSDETQIHTHMCYSEFADVIGAISDLDADVLFIENARSDLEMLEVFRSYGYEKGIGPGVYDIHSPRVPPVEEMAENLRQTVSVLGDRAPIWVNPDCGLKTRRPEEVEASLKNMVAAAHQLQNGSTDGRDGEKR